MPDLSPERATALERLAADVGAREPVWSARVVMRIADVSYRQLDFWTSEGLVPCTIPAAGSGTHRGYSAADVLVAVGLAEVHRQGIALRAAADIVDRPSEPVRIGPVTVTYHPEDVERHVREALDATPPSDYASVTHGRSNVCAADGCGAAKAQRGRWCSPHEWRVRQYGNPLAHVPVDAPLEAVRAAYGQLLIDLAREKGVDV